MGSAERFRVEPMGSAGGAAGDGVALAEEKARLDGEASIVELPDADALALPIEEDGVAEITGTGARVGMVGAEQPVAETVRVLVETTVTVTKPSVPMTTVGVTTLPMDELLVGGVVTGAEAETEEGIGTVAKVSTLLEEAAGVAELLGVLRVRI